MRAISPEQAHTLLRDSDAVLIDVRTPAEFAAGAALQAIPMPLDALSAEALAPYDDRTILFICQRDPRSRQAVEMAQSWGLTATQFVEGGSSAWHDADLPWAVADPFYERYARHLSVAEIGEAGQRKLLRSHIVMVGAGGLGSPIALYLAAAGVGRITVIDDDHIERSNLQRQVLHRDQDIGTPKVTSAERAMLDINPTLHITALQTRLTTQNAREIIAGADLVIDGADNFATRHIVNEVCFELGIPWVYGALLQFDGQVSIFDLRKPQGDRPCYRCLFPEAPDAAFAPNCTEAGVLGVLPGLVGMIQATEALKLLLGIGQPLVGQLLQVDALNMAFRKIRLRRDASCPQCGESSMR